MQICHDHWHEMKNAIRQRGLWKLVTPDGYVSAERHKQEQIGGPGTLTFDPLIAESSMIFEQASMALSASPTTPDDCILCKVEQNLGEGMAIEWIDSDADTILRFCREQHMVAAEDF